MLEVPRFSLAERDRRWTTVRRLMSEAGLDCLVVWGESAKWDSQMASIRYLTQIGGNGEEGVLLFPKEGEPTIFLWSNIMKPFWLSAQDWITDIRERDRVRNQSWVACIREQLAERGLLKGRIGLLSGSLKEKGIMPHGIYTGLVTELNQASISDGTPILERARLIKSPEEIRFLERSGEIGDAMTEALRKTAQPGVKECEVYAEVLRVMVQQGGEVPTLLLWGCGQGPGTSGPFAHPGRFPTTRTIQSGDVIIMEMHPKYGGYVTHQERTVFVGEPKKLYRDLYKAGLAAFNKSTERLTPECMMGEPIKVLRDSIRDSGFCFREAGIHGHALESGEDPYVGGLPFTPADCFAPFPMPALKFAPGMSLALNIDTTTTDWSTSTMLSDTYVITEGKPKKLTKYDLQPVIAE
jgi:Xaa-Pro dipeptidase